MAAEANKLRHLPPAVAPLLLHNRLRPPANPAPRQLARLPHRPEDRAVVAEEVRSLQCPPAAIS